MTEEKPKLYYFEAKGRAEVIRMMFAVANVDFEDIRLTLDQWNEFKARKSRLLFKKIAEMGARSYEHNLEHTRTGADPEEGSSGHESLPWEKLGVL